MSEGHRRESQRCGKWASKRWFQKASAREWRVRQRETVRARVWEGGNKCKNTGVAVRHACTCVWGRAKVGGSVHGRARERYYITISIYIYIKISMYIYINSGKLFLYICMSSRETLTSQSSMRDIDDCSRKILRNYRSLLQRIHTKETIVCKRDQCRGHHGGLMIVMNTGVMQRRKDRTRRYAK